VYDRQEVCMTDAAARTVVEKTGSAGAVSLARPRRAKAVLDLDRD
jgi:hypothetical protein